MRPARLFVAACLAGTTAAVFTVGNSGPRAQSPLEFFMNQHRQQAPRYQRVPVEVPRRGLFDFFGFGNRAPERRAPRAEKPRALQRVVCRRPCDGAQLVLGFVSGEGKHAQNEAMCQAAGRGAQTELVVEKFVPGAGFALPQAAASAPALVEGRAALDSRAQEGASPQPASCPDEAGGSAFMSVPILHDATLRRDDIVAMRGGFRVFVGKGKPPFKRSDFEALDTRKKASAGLGKLKIADR